jgi:hypothetical protein
MNYESYGTLLACHKALADHLAYVIERNISRPTLLGSYLKGQTDCIEPAEERHGADTQQP